MPPTPLLTKGSTSSLARKWRKLKKRCSSFSSGDNLSGGNGIHRSKSITSNDCRGGCHDDDEDDDGYEEGEGGVRSWNIRDKINQWNSRRRSSQGDSIAQWWQWQGSHGSHQGRPVARSTSLKGDLSQRCGRNAGDEDEEEDEDEVFVTVDPLVRAKQSGQIKNAMIVSAANPYCTGARTKKQQVVVKSAFVASRKHHVVVNGGGSSGTSSIAASPSPSPPTATSSPVAGTSDASRTSPSSSSNGNSSLLCHDQDSGYDGYCPGDKSITSIASSSSSEDPSAANAAAATEPHYGNSASYNRLAAKDIYGRIAAASASTSATAKSPAMGVRRPTSVYEKHFGGPVQQCLESASGGIYSSPRSQISQATVVNLVSSSSSTKTSQIPPPLPPRPANLFSPSSAVSSSMSLPRNRRPRKLQPSQSSITLTTAPTSLDQQTLPRRESALLRLEAPAADNELDLDGAIVAAGDSTRSRRQLEAQRSRAGQKQLDANLKVIDKK